jgi:hypothetical protein
MSSITTRVVRRARKNGVTVLNRKQWGSKSWLTYQKRRALTRAGYYGPFRRKADTVVQHITVTMPSADFAANCRTVERIGNERFGCGVSYNFLVDMTTGKVAVGQPLDSKGVHTINDKGVPGYSFDQNLVARAIAVIGMPGTKLSAKAEASIVTLLGAMRDEGAITVGFDYVPHSLFAYKDCPCEHTRSRMNEIRSAVAKDWEPKK